MTKYSDATARAKFDACGYGESCEFVKVEDDRLTARCRECGHEFERNNVILRKPQKKLRCPACHERKVNDALEWYRTGHSAKECAERFGLPRYAVQNYAARRKVHGGISREESAMRLREHNGSAKGNAVQMKRAGERVGRIVTLHGFAMLDEWRGKDATYRVRCLRCGCEFELKSQTLKKCKFACPECSDPLDDLHGELVAMRKTVDAIGRELAAAKAALDRLDRWICGERDWYADTLEAHSPQVATCKHCGGTWVHWPSREYYGRRKPSPYCSHRCAVRHNRHGKSARDRLRRYGRADEQRDSIPLQELVEREHGICYLCGEPIDWNDKHRDVDGNFVCGPNYPTREHVKPLAKGGTHTWDNVRLAHHGCNCRKATKELSELYSDGGI